MTATGLIEAAIVVAGHLIEENSHPEAVSGAAGGVHSSAG